MDQTQSQPGDKSKKYASFRHLLDDKNVDKTKIKDYFLENYSNIPQEFRLLLWKVFLGKQQNF